jgi:hypothetical protein
MKNLRERIQGHAESVKKNEELQAALAGVFSTQSLGDRERFTRLAYKTIIPAFEEFKRALREVGRDAVIVDHTGRTPVQSIGVTLVDKYLRSGLGKTITLVNPKEEISRQPNAKFYEVTSSLEEISVRQKVDSDFEPIATVVGYDDITSLFLENELGGFFERAYPSLK